MSLRSAFFCVALAATLPVASVALAQNAAPPSTQAAPAAKPATPPSTAPAATTPTPAKPVSPAQAALHQRQTTCGAEWRAAKEAGKIPAGQTWPKYWSACNKRLKAQGK